MIKMFIKIFYGLCRVHELFCELIPDCSIEFLACEDDSVTIQADIPEMLSAPVNSAQIYGTINIYVNNEPIRSISLKAKQSIPKKFMHST